MPDIELQVLLTEHQIASRVEELAAQISHDYAACDEVILIGVLKGSFIFLADLARRLRIPRRIDFISVASYGASATSNTSAPPEAASPTRPGSFSPRKSAGQV